MLAMQTRAFADAARLTTLTEEKRLVDDKLQHAVAKAAAAEAAEAAARAEAARVSEVHGELRQRVAELEEQLAAATDALESTREGRYARLLARWTCFPPRAHTTSLLAHLARQPLGRDGVR